MTQTNSKTNNNYDVVIVGAGIAGALAAYKLAQANKRVLILEAGTEVPSNRGDYMERFYLASAKTPESPYPKNLNALNATVLDIPNRGYLIQNGSLPFSSTNERRGGGTTWHWLGTCLRLLPNDFQIQTKYGRGVDWPITYNDLEPWYCEAEKEIGVAADLEDQQYLGLHFSKSYPMPGILPSYLDKQIAQGIEEMEFEGELLKVSPTPQARNSRPYDHRRVCAGNTSCIPICPIQAKYDATIHLSKAENLGAKIWYQTVAYRLEVEAETGRINGVRYKQYQDTNGGVTNESIITAKVYILAAHAIETAKLLLMSTREGLPQGVANRSDQVGRNLMDHPVQLSWALMPNPVYPFRGPLSTSGIESLRDGSFRSNRAAFRMEIGNEGWNWAQGDPDHTVNDLISSGYSGTDLKNSLNSMITRQVRFGSLVEQMPLSSNRIVPSTEHCDHLGIPRPEINYQLCDYTKAGFAAARKAAQAVFTKLGATDYTSVNLNSPRLFFYQGQPHILNGAGHTMGTYRMGFDANTSVVNADLRSHEHSNLFMLGSGVFPSVGTSNPTLTIAALALRAADKVISELNK
ncbi:MAG: GMC family oxidoreductase [Symploca sp. SIO2B6]|nr:GMC family oxidoreductase [Symploca sp. SIO2B6]